MANNSSDAYERTVLRGEMAELAFLYRAAREGIAVAKPWGASHPYDCLVQYKSRLLRIQVKSTFTEPTRTDPRAYQVVTARRIHGKHCYYSASKSTLSPRSLARATSGTSFQLKRSGCGAGFISIPTAGSIEEAGFLRSFGRPGIC